MAGSLRPSIPASRCNVIRTTAHVAYQRLAQELKAGGPQVDVFASTDVSHCLELKSKGLLESFTPANSKTVVPEVQNQDPDGTFHTTSLGVIGITYNSSKVKPGDLPTNWPDFDRSEMEEPGVGRPSGLQRLRRYLGVAADRSSTAGSTSTSSRPTIRRSGARSRTR